ncbi:MAG: carboxypeptidase-like regulatory domain-containing protein [Candidatus Sericytochromatia bacterium]|nr:carboxypeptidase-like regulatory domain-containing protein [Candidatus Sericytochromatia bacterium]
MSRRHCVKIFFRYLAAPMMAGAILLFLTSACSGGASPGIISGLITYAGKPAAGKRVQLMGGERIYQSTGPEGRYTFEGISQGRYQIIFRSEGDQPKALPNEIAEWRSLPFDFSAASGKEIPPIEVAYNGLLYPDEGMALIVNEEALVPFHWSTHPRALNYRVRLEAEAGTFRWNGPWTSEPTAIFGQAVNTGRYRWLVEIDGGETGMGASRPRQVDF